MRWVVFLLLAVLVMGGRFAVPQQPNAVTGVVLTPDGKPVADATVWLVIQEVEEVGRTTVEASTTTDVQGRFQFAFKPLPGIYNTLIIAHHPKFAIGFERFDLRDLKPVTVRLNHPAPLAGIVLTPDGKPLAGVKVQVRQISSGIRMAFDLERREFFLFLKEVPEALTPLRCTTDENGHFAFHHLPARTQITLLATHPDFAPTQLPTLENWLLVRTGQTDIALVMRPKSFVTGRVLVDGKPAANAQVICVDWLRQEGSLQFPTDSDGNFNGALSEGRWFIYAIADDGRWQSEPQYISISPGETISVTLNLLCAVEVRGVVKDAEKKEPAPFTIVAASRDLRLPQVWTSWRTESVKADEKGAYRLFLLPGKWTIQAMASYKPGLYAFAKVELDVQGETMEAPDLLLQPQLLVQVQVVDEKGKPIPRAIVTDGYNPTRADENGIAQMPTYFRSIWAATPDLTMFGSAELQPAAETVRIVVRKGVPVTGQVTDERGKPVPNTRLLVQALKKEPVGVRDWFEVSTDNQGHFKFHLPAGQQFQLIALAPDFFPTQTAPFTPEEGKPMKLTIPLLRPDLTVEGTIVDDETGQPIWGAAIRAWVGYLSAEFGSFVAFTDRQGRFQLRGLCRDRLSGFEIWHPTYESIRQFRPSILPQGRILLERRRPRISPQLAEGKPAPPLSDVQWLDGEPPSLQGKTTYLLFAMAFNPTCEQTLQNFKELQARAPDQKTSLLERLPFVGSLFKTKPSEIQVIVIFDASLPVDELKRYVQEMQLPFRIGVVPAGRMYGWDSETFQRYGVKFVPFLVVVDEKGIVQAINP